MEAQWRLNEGSKTLIETQGGLWRLMDDHEGSWMTSGSSKLIETHLGYLRQIEAN